MNSSGRPQTFTAPVAFPDVVQATQYIKQNGWNLQNENSRIMFNGGVTGTRNSANYENRVFCGHWVLSETPYPALPIDGSKRPTVYRNSSFTVDQISSSQAMWVMDGGAVTSATLTVDSKCVATTCLGQFVVNGTMTYDTDKDTSASGGRSTTDKFDFNNGGNNTVATVKAVTMNMTGSRGVKLGGNGVAITSKIYLGSGGMSASGTQCYYVSNSGAQLVLKPWKCDTSINQSAAGENAATIEMRTSGTALTFDTDDEDGVARTISLDGIVSTVADATSSVKGAGTLAVKKSQSFAGSLSVDDTATLKVAQSGTVTLGGNLTLGASASLAFNFTDKATAPTLVIPASSTIPATVNVKVSANDGIRLSPSQTYALTSTFDFTGKTVHLVNPPKWVKSVYVDGSGNLVMKLKQKGFMILVK